MLTLSDVMCQRLKLFEIKGSCHIQFHFDAFINSKYFYVIDIVGKVWNARNWMWQRTFLFLKVRQT